MKIMLLDKARGIPGTYGGAIQLSHLLGDIKLSADEIAKAAGYARTGKDNEEYILSLRDEILTPQFPGGVEAAKKACGTFTLGDAKGSVMLSTSSSGTAALKISVESPNAPDFLDLLNKLYNEKFGIPHTNFPRTVQRMEELSFVRGIGNDIRNLWRFFAAGAMSVLRNGPKATFD